MNNNQLTVLSFVDDNDDILQSLTTFNIEAINNHDLARKLLRNTTYWVFDPVTQTFGPSKFVGFKDMDFSRYTLALNNKMEGVRFDGERIRKAIEKKLGVFKINNELNVKLIEWGEVRFGSDIFKNLRQDKWRFISLLPYDGLSTPTYLLTWNPGKWSWDDIQADTNLIDVQGYCSKRWSCGITKKIAPDDRVFLIKLGRNDPRGIIASGWAKSKVFEGDHWDAQAAAEGKTANYINVRFDTILDLEKLIFPREKLDQDFFSKMNWQPQASGRTIPIDVAYQLEKEWANFVGQHVPLKNNHLPEEVESTQIYKEGATKKIIVNAYERSTQARSICIKHYGLNCSVCDFNFEAVYGHIGENFVHVHHLKTLARVGSDYELNPIEDLRPVCPNCHAMLHSRKPEPFTIQELKTIIQKQINQSDH